jgi:hypothetical protein
MKVWIVLKYTGYEDVDILGVFSKSAVAHQFLREQKAKKKYFTSYNIEKWGINETEK